MNPDSGSLDNLRDIAVPPAVPWWPLAPGWYVVGTLALLGIALLTRRQWKLWKRNAYRREAMLRLHEAATTPEIADLLKRTALAAFPRFEVAALSGEDWCLWLEKTSVAKIPAATRLILAEGVFNPDQNADSGELRAFASGWIKNHQPRSIDETAEKEMVAC